ncbi:glycosyl transferase, partial [Tulasnella sp. 403]
LLAADNQAHFRTFIIANVAGIFSLFPLLFTPAETPVKIIYSVIWGVLTFGSLGRRVYEPPSSKLTFIIDILEKAYLAGFIPLQVFVSLFPVLTGASLKASPDEVDAAAAGRMEFLPLMLTSIYCAVGLVWAFIRLGTVYIHTY